MMGGPDFFPTDLFCVLLLIMKFRASLVICVLTICVFAVSCVADEPVARWTFQTPAAESALINHGAVLFGEPGPQPPEYPDFAADNSAIRLDGKGARLMLADADALPRFAFANGDDITLEAWVKLESAGENQAMYVIGKGRTGASEFAKDNQNWALRLATSRGTARLSFLFATQPASGSAKWHRWDSTGTFAVASGWHHIAVAYRFGEPDSIRGWIDGLPGDGVWSFSGPTTEPPIVDNDAVWIGSALGGSPSNSFRGWLDEVAVHRVLLDDQQIATRFHRVGGPQVMLPEKPQMPELGDIPAGQVLVTFSEGLPSHERWPYAGENWPQETTRWHTDLFLLPRVPVRYDDWGIRMGWKAPLLIRMAADVELSLGSQQLLLRARALSRLWVDGRLIAETEAITKDPPNGEEPILPVATPLLPGLRLPSYRQQEVTGNVVVQHAVADAAGADVSLAKPTSRVVLEMVVGGPKLRVDTGEILVALLGETANLTTVLTADADRTVPLVDQSVEPESVRLKSLLSAFDDAARRGAAGSQDAFWKQRHAVAWEWADSHPAPSIPETSANVSHPIDRFLMRKIEAAAVRATTAADATAADFHDNVLPILRKNCFRCHDTKAKGGLVVSSREPLLRGGHSQTPAILPEQPADSELIQRVRSTENDYRMPPTGSPLEAADVAILERWIQGGAVWPAAPVTQAELQLAPLVSDAAFLRRAYLDTVGVPPTLQEAEIFLSVTSGSVSGDFLSGNSDASQQQQASQVAAKQIAAKRRNELVQRLLDDQRWADNWMGEWQDMLAENPTLLNKSQGSTGPFRFFLHDALRDHKPVDRMVTELILMRGGAEEGGSAGFALAAENDAPFAGKAHILASAFLGIELQCARCHDAPFHDVSQQDLFSLAAMLQKKPASVPGTSSVPVAFFEQQDRQPLIQVTLKPGSDIPPEWPFAALTGVADGANIDLLMQQPDDTRERLAALITSPENRRFPRVIVNRIWHRLMGAGLVEPVHDWEGRSPSHPQLLDWLAHQFVSHGYNMRHIMHLVMTSEAYQREATGENRTASAERRYFNAPDRRRLSAEQIVDSLFTSVSIPMDIGELTFVHDGRRPLSNRQTLGHPQRAWMLASLNNERDRPSLALPRAQAITDVLEAFGWTGSRQKPIAERNVEPNLLQPGVLSNGVLASTLSRASTGSPLAELAVNTRSPEQLVDVLFLRILTRLPNATETAEFSKILANGFDSRLLSADQMERPQAPERLPRVTWFNHLRPDANTIQQELERRVRQGPPSDPRLSSGWREVYEDVVWSLINHRDFVWIP